MAQFFYEHTHQLLCYFDVGIGVKVTTVLLEVPQGRVRTITLPLDRKKVGLLYLQKEFQEEFWAGYEPLGQGRLDESQKIGILKIPDWLVRYSPSISLQHGIVLPCNYMWLGLDRG